MDEKYMYLKCPEYGRIAYPKNLALFARNLIVQIATLVPPEDRETYEKFMAIVCEVELQFKLGD